MPDIAIGTRATVVHAAAATLQVAHGTIVATSDDGLELLLEEDVQFPASSKVILDMPASDPPRLIVLVVAHEDRRLEVRLRRVPVTEALAYPRVTGPLEVRYRLARAPGDPARWLAGEHVAAVEHTPDPHMSFSVTGLAFEDGPHLRADDTLLIGLSVPGEAHVWRCVGRVARARPLPPAPGATATHRYTVDFLTIPDEASRALARYTVRIQERILAGRQA